MSPAGAGQQKPFGNAVFAAVEQGKAQLLLHHSNGVADGRRGQMQLLGRFVEAADVMDLNLTYSYKDDAFWYFMHPETFEQYSADAKAVGDAEKWLLDQADCIVTLWNGAPITVTPPNFVELEIIDTDPGLKGDTAGTGGKPATLSTGAVVKVPLFVQIGEVIKVDTRSGEYVSRVK